MLQLNELTKRYKTGELALKGVTLEIPKGQVLALIGPSGAGKSTLIRCVNRLVQPTSGSVALKGKELTKLSSSALVTGPTGSGKTTTLAALLDHINHTRAEHILTIEDPIEFVYNSDRSLVHQRQLNEDTRSFANALRAALREDPDVILVGEMRDLETIQLAISAAETGHLVFGTLHTSSAAQTVDRMVDVFPPGQQTQIRVQLSGSLTAVFSQTLCRRQNPAPGQFGRVMAQEIMINTPAIANLIREGKTAQLYSQIQTGGERGMQTLERALADLIDRGEISLINLCACDRGQKRGLSTGFVNPLV